MLILLHKFVYLRTSRSIDAGFSSRTMLTTHILFLLYARILLHAISLLSIMLLQGRPLVVGWSSPRLSGTTTTTR